MHWYGGSIAEAVTLSKQRNAIFVVFVEGDNDLSTEMAATIDDQVVLSRLSDETNFLAVKLKSGTTNYTHFAQIYQFVPVPSLFFIGRNGTPLEVVCAGVPSDNLATRIDRILSEHRKEKSPMQPSTSSQTIKQDTADLIRAEKTSDAPKEVPKEKEVPREMEVSKEKEVPSQEVKDNAPAPSPPKISKPSPEHEIVCDGDVCVRRPKADQPSTSQTVTPVTPPPTPADEVKKLPEPSSSSGSVEDKIDRAKELIEARRREKAEKEKQLEKQKELERRSTGQGVTELKQWQADQELKQIQEERKREKLENNLARQRILAQIAQDRAERKARDVPVAVVPNPSTPVTNPPLSTPMTTGDTSSEARVQFKLPDGSSHTAHFPADDTLANVQRYVADNLHLSSNSFSLWTAFPRRELVESDATLRQLQLAPSAALLVLPRRDPQPAPRPAPFAVIYAFLTRLLTSIIYEPSLQLYTWLSVRLFPPPAVGRGSPTPPRDRAAPTGVAGVRLRRTNIHRLPGDAPDDDNNTWNGNSTQQM